jgi:hypothetical protein
LAFAEDLAPRIGLDLNVLFESGRSDLSLHLPGGFELKGQEIIEKGHEKTPS